MSDPGDDYRRQLYAYLEEAAQIRSRGVAADAIPVLREAMVFIENNGGGEDEAILVLLRLGDVHAEAGQDDQALECYNEAAERSQKTSFIQGVLDATQRRVAVYVTSGRWQMAADTAREGRSIAASLGDKTYEAVFVGLLGQIARRGGDLDLALSLAFDGLQLAQASGNFDEELTFLGDMALVSLDKGNYQEALEQAEAGCRRCLETGRESRAIVFLGQKCHALRGLSRFDDARDCARDGLLCAENEGNVKEIATFLHDLALLELIDGNVEDAVKSCMKSYKLFLELGNKEGALTTLRGLAQMFAQGGDWEAAFNATVDAMVLSADMDKRLFLNACLGIPRLTEQMWRTKSFAKIEHGLGIVDVFFEHIEKNLQGEDGSPNLLGALRTMIASLVAAARSRGNGDSDEAMEARELASRVDATIGTTLEDFINGLYEDDFNPLPR